MKNGYKHFTGLFGTDGEHYTSRLFMMMKNPNGSYRPDLISINGRFNPKFSLEVKSGRKNKGVMVRDQLRYAITTHEDYEALFGKEQEGFLPGLASGGYIVGERIAYYYDQLDRLDCITSDGINKPYSTIRLEWGDHHLVPHECGFYMFAICMAKRTGKDVKDTIEYLREMMKDNIDTNSSPFGMRDSKDSQSWQNIHGRDIIAIFKDDMGLASKPGRERIRLLQTHYEQFDSLRKIRIPGPNKTSVYILAEPQDYNLFNNQLRKTVKERTPIIEAITRERKRARSLLDKIKPFYGQRRLIRDIPANQKFYSQKSLSEKERALLNRLTMWLAKDENPLTVHTKIRA